MTPDTFIVGLSIGWLIGGAVASIWTRREAASEFTELFDRHVTEGLERKPMFLGEWRGGRFV